MTEAAHGIFPMVLGVTGHRDLRVEDERILEQRVLDLIRMIKRTYPHTPLVLLSPLAEGADRLVAEVALAEGVQLVAPLPMPAEEYESDFEDEISREAFRNLLRRAAYSFSLPLRSSLTMIREGGQARSLQYEQVGAYIARHSQILIALWDGISLNLTGGTSRIIEFQLRGVPEPYASPRSPLDQLETGLVYHILTPRRTNPCPAGVPFSIRLLLPEGNESDEPEPITPGRNATGTHAGNDVLEFPARYLRIFERLDLCNKDARQLGPTLASRETTRSRHFPAESEIGGRSPEFERNVGAFLVVDELASRFARSTHRALWFLATTAVVAVACFDVFHVLRVALFAYLYVATLIGALVWWYSFVKRRDIQDRYLDYRALAEGLRVQSYWRLAGVTDCVAEHYLRKQKSELDWIRDAIRVIEIPRSPSPACHDPASGSPQYDLVLRYWINDQRAWYQQRTLRDHRGMVRSRWGVSLLFAAGLILAVVAALSRAFRGGPWTDAVLIFSTLPLAWAGLWEGAADKMAYEDQRRQYHRMHQVFERASVALEAAIDRQDGRDAETIIRELGREALAENGDWVVLHRARPLEVPKA